MGFKAEMLAAGTVDEWNANGLVFKTSRAADLYGFDLLLRWTGAREYRVTEVDDEPTMDSHTVQMYEDHVCLTVAEVQGKGLMDEEVQP